jgi:hypothetical protein
MLLYWPLWVCIFKRAGFVHREMVNRISSLHSNIFAYGTWRRWRLIDTVLHAVHFVKIDELHNWIYVIDLILMHWLLYSELWCYLLIQGIAHLHRSFTFSKRWGATPMHMPPLCSLYPWYQYHSLWISASVWQVWDIQWNILSMEPHTWQISDHDESASGQKPCGDEDLATYG